MSNNIEIIMDIETLEIFEVIDLDKEKEVITKVLEESSESRKASPYDDLDRIWLGNGYYYKPSSLLWEVVRDGIVHELSPRNKHGTYPYYEHSRNGTWGHVKQLTQEEALWLTLDLNSDLMSYV
ncbi:hypothetical protein MP619_04535 [Streptococcus dysgalactiae]|uniref:Uncharacterized protein n=3 Tax=Streptococcus TaxID=1301 RepID=A0A3L8GDA2_STRIN|nr:MULTISPECIES: hypothetical protein [Streptococcus]HER9225391.1 hypothetical protein [Streptococcus pyogenes]MCD3397155.1 hypothetical protein [Streptococcus equi subsp. zooepidemicus]MCD3427186.1 hypothetical protein [Streptococcus equi subsp. zooepidemicus]MCD3436115.1 hypothetical protein [Streptococcus equi subsp. zooepidemicus]MCD3438038.1 hypothetical protein [Streptococcus equi subsp. zooepidemicus]